MMESIDDNVKNIYVIRRNLANLKRLEYGNYEYMVGSRLPPFFMVKIYTHRIQDPPLEDPNDNILKHSRVDVIVDEHNSRTGFYDRLNLSQDPRFKNYQPIQYEGGWNGDKMPILQLCELIKYLHRLENLAIFA